MECRSVYVGVHSRRMGGAGCVRCLCAAAASPWLMLATQWPVADVSDSTNGIQSTRQPTTRSAHSSSGRGTHRAHRASLLVTLYRLTERCITHAAHTTLGESTESRQRRATSIVECSDESSLQLCLRSCRLQPSCVHPPVNPSNRHAGEGRRPPHERREGNKPYPEGHVGHVQRICVSVVTECVECIYTESGREPPALRVRWQHRLDARVSVPPPQSYPLHAVWHDASWERMPILLAQVEAEQRGGQPSAL